MDAVSEHHLLRRLAFDNPWWDFSSDTEIRFRHPPKRAFYPAFAEQVLARETGEALVLAGSRGTGKTVMIRQMIAQLIESGVAPRSILYVGMTTTSYIFKELDQLFGLFCARHGHQPTASLYVFFDEAQYGRDWRTALTALARALPRTRFVAAVSAEAPALTPREAPDGMTVQILPPLTFVEFLRFRGNEEKLFGPGAGKPQGKAVFRETALALLNAEFHRYVNFGGFPEGILHSSTDAPAPTFIRDTLIDRVLHRDLAGLAGISDTRELNRLFVELALNSGREVGIESLAKTTGIAKNTVRKYLTFLEHAFLIRRVDRVDGKAKRFQRAVTFKAYLTSPSLHAALFGPSDVEGEDFPGLAETALAAQWPYDADAGELVYA
ncbi:MAG: AAA family ATPase, partial [Rhodospirillales bacterium]|nr:AAA family ATPase [Rhodospirillales bacterium]